MSQGLLDYSHVLQSLSNFTCSNIKILLSILRFDICDDELTNTNSSAFASQVWYLLIYYKIGEIRLESEVI